MPEVVPLLPDNRPARPPLVPGRWLLQEFCLRGERFRWDYTMKTNDVFRTAYLYIPGCTIYDT